MQLFKTILQWCGTGFDETAVLLVLMIFDSVLGVSWRFRRKRFMISSTAVNGIIRNSLTCLLPSLLELIRIELDHHSLIFRIISLLISIIIGFTLLQSICANLKMNGVDLPQIIENIFGEAIQAELNDKEKRL